jgi:hypothetical protein
MSCANRNDDSCFAGSLLSYIDECWKAYIKSLEHGVGFHLQFFSLHWEMVFRAKRFQEWKGRLKNLHKDVLMK